jgi:hypothetical protein
MPKPQINTRVEEDIADEIEAFAEEANISKSEAARRFLVSGMGNYDRLPDTVQQGDREMSPLADVANYLVSVGALLSLVALVPLLLSPGGPALVIAGPLLTAAWAILILGVAALIGLHAHKGDPWFAGVPVVGRRWRS